MGAEDEKRRGVFRRKVGRAQLRKGKRSHQQLQQVEAAR
jgi:hypothetical protein